ncbi:MAG: hypothetical protein JXA87_00930 [Thermoleophilia bacterium]|nr:hypothetical protein [Thermoleophilia bacterium]
MSPEQALERVRPEERALIQTGVELGLVKYAAGGGMLIDLTSDKLQQEYNVLAPAATIAKADPNFTPSVSVIKLNPDLENGGDWYPIETEGRGDNKRVKAVALTKRALDQIAQKAGIEDRGPEIVYFGDRKQNVRITWHARVRNQDGWTYRELAGSQEWVEEAETALLKSSPPEWAQKGDSAYNEWWAKNWWGRVHKFRIRMTETKARLAAYRQALTVKQKYTPAESRKPFLVVSLTYTPDTSNPAVLGALMGQGQEARQTLFGPTPEAERPAIEAAEERVETVDAETGEIVDVEPETNGPRPSADVQIPRGPFAGMLLSEICREHQEYAKTKLLPTKQLGPDTDAWLRYWHGEEAVADDYSDITF